MTAHSLDAQIAQLRSALNAHRGKPLDSTTRDALQLLQHDVAHVLHDESVTQKLEDLAVRFETEHPAAGAAIREVVNTLVKVGM
jgi:hypothetical protein